MAIHEVQRERVVRALSLATFVIFFQAYMVGPIIPRLARVFRSSVQTAGLIVPAYLIPYGAATLAFGLLADRFGLRRVMFGSLTAFVALTALTATAATISDMVLWRLLTGLGASGVVPLGLVLIGVMFPYAERGRPLGWLFGAMAGGMAFGSTFGAVLEPFAGWRGIFLGTSAAGLLVLFRLWPYRSFMGGVGALPASQGVSAVFATYRSLLGSARGRRTYAYVLANAVFHSGVFTWLGLYFERRYGLGELGIGLALLGYGVPGFLLGPTIGRWADRWGRGRLLPVGLFVSTLAAASLVPTVPLVVAALAVTLLSLGYDLTQPLLGGIVTDLGGPRRGQAMGLNVFALFSGFGLGSLAFGELLRFGLGPALGLFSVVELTAGLAAIALFRSEVRPGAASDREAPETRAGRAGFVAATLQPFDAVTP